MPIEHQGDSQKISKMNDLSNQKAVEHNDLITSVAKMDKVPLKIFELAVSCQAPSSGNRHRRCCSPTRSMTTPSSPLVRYARRIWICPQASRRRSSWIPCRSFSTPSLLRPTYLTSSRRCSAACRFRCSSAPSSIRLSLPTPSIRLASWSTAWPGPLSACRRTSPATIRCVAK